LIAARGESYTKTAAALHAFAADEAPVRAEHADLAADV
jgi:hypothetical protein